MFKVVKQSVVLPRRQRPCIRLPEPKAHGAITGGKVASARSPARIQRIRRHGERQDALHATGG